MNLTLNKPCAGAGFPRFVPCAAGPGVVKPLMLRAHCATSGAKALVSPAVFQSGKSQASLLRVNNAPAAVAQMNLTRSEICRGIISQQKIKTKPRRKDAKSAK
jgi:hypothetical protein